MGLSPGITPGGNKSVQSINSTSNYKPSPGVIYKIYWTAGVASTLAAYDSTGATINQFVSKITTTDGEVDFGPVGAACTNGITIATTGSTPAFVVILWK